MTGSLSPLLATGFFVPRAYFLAAGAGDASSPLVAFDRALLSVGLGNINLVRLSSILAPGLPNARPAQIQTGAFVGAAYATVSSNTAGALIAAAVAVAHPMEEDRESIIMEKAGMIPAKDIESQTVEMAIQALTSRGLRLKNVETVRIEHVVSVVGSVFAAVIEV